MHNSKVDLFLGIPLKTRPHVSKRLEKTSDRMKVLMVVRRLQSFHFTKSDGVELYWMIEIF